jgi:CO dehydrogenase maturation factor
MMKTIAISGKGGTGKTSLAALLIRGMSEQESKSILAIDADPNVNLNDLLGIKPPQTIGRIREEMRRSSQNLDGGMTKQQFLEYKIQASLEETEKYDLIAMGRPEGPGCYCYANNLLREILKILSSNYRYTVIDNEAGMEHLSRRTAQSIDLLLIVATPSIRDIRAAGRINRLLEEIETRVGEKLLILNRSQGSLPAGIQNCIQEEGLDLFFSIPEDMNLLEMDQAGTTIWDIPSDSPALQAVNRLRQKLAGLETKTR